MNMYNEHVWMSRVWSLEVEVGSIPISVMWRTRGLWSVGCWCCIRRAPQSGLRGVTFMICDNMINLDEAIPLASATRRIYISFRYDFLPWNCPGWAIATCETWLWDTVTYLAMGPDLLFFIHLFGIALCGLQMGFDEVKKTDWAASRKELLFAGEGGLVSCF